MKSLSLLQTSLDQKIELEALEAAAMAAPSVARFDCRGIARDLFGIVVPRLPEPEALAFQKALAAKGFETEAVEHSKLPVLHKSFQIWGLARRGDAVVVTDSIGREMARPKSDLVFLAGGYVAEPSKPDETSFRLDLFFWKSPHRMHLRLDKESLGFHADQQLRLRDEAALAAMMADMAGLLPAARLNQALRDPLKRFSYPCTVSYEEEIRWHFHQLAKPVATP